MNPGHEASLEAIRLCIEEEITPASILLTDIMRLLIVVIIFVFPLAASAATVIGRTVRVSDGDTIVILSEGNILQGIDAPERGQSFGAKSKRHLSGWGSGRHVVVETNKHDRYGRVVGKVLVGGKDICLEQIKAGLAWHYKKYQNGQTASDRKLYAEAEDEGRQAKLGLWQDPHAVPPWEYRAARRR